jgi:hypothetical protein
MAAATSMSLLPIYQLKQQHHAAGTLQVVFRRRPQDPPRRRYVVTVRADIPDPSLYRNLALLFLFGGRTGVVS